MEPTVVGIDTGGTFTDLLLIRGGELRVHKLPSTPEEPTKGILQGLAELGIGQANDGAEEVLFVHGTTVATNALLERKGASTALVTTTGFEDLLEIGRQTRPRLYDLAQERPPPLVPRELRFGVQERVGPQGQILQSLSVQEARRVAREVRASGAEAVAVSLLFSFLNPTHEDLLRKVLEPPPFLSVSSQVLPQYREYERTSTVTVNAYVGPLMSRYLGLLEEALASSDAMAGSRRVRVMQSSGGAISARAAADQPVRTILSGPAGGVVGAFAIAAAAGLRDIITLDMGGTSTDVALCPGGIQETGTAVVGGVPVSVPMIDIHTVGAGGGSIARIDAGGALQVGPESAGADPGPACYGHGQEATVTDANLLLGRIDPGYFLGGRMALDLQAARHALERLAMAMGGERGPERAAAGVVRVVNATMGRALRAISQERGFDPRRFTLVAFGGAGPQHACELARELGIPRVLVPPFPGALSAYGVATADVVKDYSRTLLLSAEALTPQLLAQAFGELEARGRQELQEEGVPRARMVLHRLLEMRYVGQSYELSVDCPPLTARGTNRVGRSGEKRSDVARSAAQRFHRIHRGRFGYADPSQPVELVTVRLKAVGLVEKPGLGGDGSQESGPPHSPKAKPVDRRDVFFEGARQPTPFYLRNVLEPGDTLPGPAVLLQMDATTVVPPGWNATVDGWGNLALSR